MTSPLMQKMCLTLLMTAAWLIVMTATSRAAEINIEPAAPTTDKPVTLTVTNCSNCADFVWVVKKIDDASVVDGGDGYTMTKNFPLAGTYRVMVTGVQWVSDPYLGQYSQYVSKTREFTVAAAPFTIVLTPNPKWTVRGTIGQDDGIACAVGAKASLYEETYAPGQHLHLKVMLNDGEEMLGWQVNDKVMTDDEFLNMLTPE